MSLRKALKKKPKVNLKEEELNRESVSDDQNDIKYVFVQSVDEDSSRKVKPKLAENETQTEVIVKPHFLNKTEEATVYRDTETQTSLCFFPTDSPSNVVVNLRLKIHHDGIIWETKNFKEQQETEEICDEIELQTVSNNEQMDTTLQTDLRSNQVDQPVVVNKQEDKVGNTKTHTSPQQTRMITREDSSNLKLSKQCKNKSKLKK